MAGHRGAFGPATSDDPAARKCKWLYI